MFDRHNRRKILLVDHDPKDAKATKKILEDGGYEVIVSTRGTQTVRKLREEYPDLVVLSLMLPDRNGLSICRELKNNPRTFRVPVLVLTGATKNGGHLREIALFHGADGYLEKSVMGERLLGEMERLMTDPRRAPQMQKTSVLVADDDPDFWVPTKRTLETNGYRVLVAHNGEECIQMAREYLPEMIILAVMLPDTDGYTVCAELKENGWTRGIPVLIVTRLAGELKDPNFARDTAIQHGADDYAAKPIENEELMKKVRLHTRVLMFS